MSDALAWLFFADYTFSPLAIFGAVSVGWCIRATSARKFGDR